MLPALNFNLLSQRILSQSGNIGYLARGATRIQTVPENRKADYMFRDFYMSIITAYFVEVAFRTGDTLYTAPLMHRLLELDRLGFKKFPDALTKRMLGSLVSAKSNDVLADVLKADRIPESQKQILVEQLLKRTHYDRYLAEVAKLSPEQVAQVQGHIRDLAPKINEAIGKEIQHSGAKGISGLVDPAIAAKVEGPLLSHLDDGVRKLVSEGIKSQRVMETLQRVQKTSGWPKIVIGLAVNFLYFGLAGNWFDFKVLQPWQRKMAEMNNGSSQFIVAPSFIAMIPGLAGLLAAGKMPGVKNLGYLSKFAATGAVGITAYSATVVAMCLARAKQIKARAQGQTPPAAAPALPAASSAPTGQSAMAQPFQISQAPAAAPAALRPQP